MWHWYEVYLLLILTMIIIYFIKFHVLGYKHDD